MRYFDHDTLAASDDKIMALRLECGGAAVDAYWTIIEQIYHDETPFPIRGNQHVTKAVSHRLCIGSDTLQEWVSTMVEIGLLSWDETGENVTSKRIEENIEKYRQRQETARQNGKKGGRKPKANQVETDVGCKPLTKEKEKEKIKESKPKKSSRFSPPTKEEVSAYASEKSLPLDVEKFMDFYESKGWKVGSSPMKDWKAAARRAAKEWARDNAPVRSNPDALCPSCGAKAWRNTQTGRFHCPECYETFSGKEAVA